MGGLYTGIRPVHIYPASRMVSDYSGMMVQVGWAGSWTCKFLTTYL
jgi:hypothetical protein